MWVLISSRCKIWVQNCRRADILGKKPEDLFKSYVLCGTHFEDSQYMNATQRNKLKWDAVPTVFAIPNPPKPVTLKRSAPKRDGPSAVPPKTPKQTGICNQSWSTTVKCVTIKIIGL